MLTARTSLLIGTISTCALLACDVADAADREAVGAVAGLSETDADRFVGQYAFAGGDDERTTLRNAIEDLVGMLNALVRGVARDKLTETNPVFEKVSIERKGAELVLKFGTLTNACKLDGSVTEVPGIDGSTLTCRLSMQGDALVQQLSGSRGGRVNTFSIGKSGRLAMKTRIHSKMMPADLRYTLTFKR
jgi:hypothetical protein